MPTETPEEFLRKKYAEQEEDGNSILAKSILAAAPTLVGGLFGGAQGLAAGGQIGAKSVSDLQAREDARRKSKDDMLREFNFDVAKAGKIEEARLTAKSKYPEADQKKFQQYQYLDSKGVVRKGVFNPSSGEYRLSENDPMAGLAPQVRIDPNTLGLVTVNPTTREVSAVGQVTKPPAGGVAPQRQLATSSDREVLNPLQQKQLGSFRKELLGDKEIQETRKKLSSADQFIKLIDLENPTADEASKKQFARLAGEVGPLSDQDVQMLGGSRGLAARFNQAIETAKSGKFSPENRGLFREAATILKKVQEQRLNAAIGSFKKSQLGASNLSEQQIERVINPFMAEEQEQGAPPMDEQKASRLQELEAKYPHLARKRYGK